MKRIFSIALLMCSVLGLLDASYLAITEFSGKIPECRPPFDCGKVLESSWSSIGPVPLYLLGLFFYGTLLLLCAANVLELSTFKVGKYILNVKTILFIFGCLGLAFSLYLFTIMGVVLHAWCLYCLLSAINCVIVFILTSSQWKNAHSPLLFQKEKHEVTF